MNKNKTFSHFSFVGFILFLIPLTISISFGIIIFNQLNNKYENVFYISVFLLIYIVMIALIFTFIDIIRRKKMLDEPIRKILSATNRISGGDFDVYISPYQPHNKYNQYDIIINNINKMATELSKSELLKNDFISNVSHEIKTPLSIIKNYSQALLTQKLTEETQKKYLEYLISATNKISNLVTNVLKLNKLENQTITLSETDNNISDLLTESILAFEEQIENKKINLNCDIDEIVHNFDGGYWEIIFNNLISNAVKFTNNNGEINISLKLINNQIIFSVSDNGIGMSKKVGERIFDKFYQGDTSHSQEGNGLGLALVKRIIDLIGGEIQVKSEENKGTTFIVKINKEN